MGRLEPFQRREAGRLAVAQRQIGAATGTYEDLRTAVLVEEYLAGARLLELRLKEVLEDGLAAARRPDD